MRLFRNPNVSRRNFVKTLTGGILAGTFPSLPGFLKAQNTTTNDIFHIHSIPDNPFIKSTSGNLHAGIESLLQLMGIRDLKFYYSDRVSALSGPQGLIAPQDVVLIKVNAQWKYRGCTNSDLIRGLIQRILDHPDGFAGEVVLFENGQSRGSLNCDTNRPYGESSVRANANNEKHSFIYLINEVFKDQPVSGTLLDPLIITFIEDHEHKKDGYRRFENVSYPCFTTAGGNRVELQKGIWNGKGYDSHLKLINVPVLKHHDSFGSEITGAVKHFYGILSMHDGWRPTRHYDTLGETCGRMIASVCTPVLNIMDAIWVSHGSLRGHPESATFRANQLAASQDPVALDYWAAKHILFPIDGNQRHHPDFRGIQKWMDEASLFINSQGGIKDTSKGIRVDKVTKDEKNMRVFSQSTRSFFITGTIKRGDALENGSTAELGLAGVTLRGLPYDPLSDENGNYQASVIKDWNGIIIPEKKGYTFSPQQREFHKVDAKRKNQDFLAYASIAEPLEFRGKRITNRGLFFLEHIVQLNWKPNPENRDTNITHYRIYETTDGSPTYQAEVESTAFECLLRSIPDQNPRTYEIVAVSNQGREGAPSAIRI